MSDTISDTEKINTNEEKSEFIIKCENLIKEINETSKKHKDDIRELIKFHKKELKKVQTNKPVKINNTKRGITKSGPIPDQIANFLGLEKGTIMPRTKVGSLLMQEFKKRNLVYPQDKRIVVPNDDVKKLFPTLKVGKEISTDAKDPNGLSIYTLQKYIADCYNIKTNKKQSKKLVLGD